MAAYRSFISERTAEYIIVPDLCRTLRRTSRRILPFFFWSTREGNAVSRRQMQDTTVRVLTVFARRPKIRAAKAGVITMKLNASIIEYAHESAEIGVPVIAAMPLASALTELHSRTRCIYIDLKAQPTGGDVFIHFGHADGVVEELSGTQIAALVGAARRLAWTDVAELLSSLRAVHLKHNYPYFAGYRPVHLAFEPQQLPGDAIYNYGQPR